MIITVAFNIFQQIFHIRTSFFSSTSFSISSGFAITVLLAKANSYEKQLFLLHLQHVLE